MTKRNKKERTRLLLGVGQQNINIDKTGERRQTGTSGRAQNELELDYELCEER